jgi:hypothetical protein
MPERRGRVDDDVLVEVPDRVELVLEPKVAVELPHQLDLGLRQRDSRAQDVEVLVA